MPEAKVVPFGEWKSPISAATIVQDSVGIGQIALDDGAVFWTEQRPAENGRTALVRCCGDGEPEDIVPAPFSVRSRVHEYGGGAFAVHDGTVWFCNDSDQRLYRQAAGGSPAPVTEEGAWRFADLVVDAPRDRIIAVREDHGRKDGEPVNELVAIGTAGSITVLATGADFYSAPRISPDGARLAWLSWNHPHMPWSDCILSEARLDAAGSPIEARHVAGGDGEAVFQPEWSPDGTLYFVSDRSGWWNLYRCDGSAVMSVCPMEAEFGLPQWIFNMRTYGFADAQTILCAYLLDGIAKLARIDVGSGEIRSIPVPYIEIHGLVADTSGVVFSGGGLHEPTALIRLGHEEGAPTVIRRSMARPADARFLSKAQPVSFASADGRTAHGFYYPPRNDDYEPVAGSLPPLIVKSHGGPTGQSGCALSLKTQFWTSRGFAVLDVNYGGSTGYGRAYRNLLFEAWGLVDVEDCVAGAEWLVERGLVDPAKLAITGGSAGGYTTLCALTYFDTFKAGASHYGIGDLEALARDTHKFESRYLDWLIGKWPEAAERYRERSPIHHVDKLNCPVIFFQGLEDKVVPPNQAEAMVAALREKGIPVAYQPFEGEGHGFRRADNVKRALEGELFFYGQVFGFAPADKIEPVEILNLA
jgi:dipeptidyl aminopeptidase/acylaminoacyl peptidase